MNDIVRERESSVTSIQVVYKMSMNRELLCGYGENQSNGRLPHVNNGGGANMWGR